MICPNCGTENMDGATTCARCGAQLMTQAASPAQFEPIQTTVQPVQPPIQPAQSIISAPEPVAQPILTSNQNNTQPQPIINNTYAGGTKFNFLMYIFASLIKPFKCFKEEENKLSIFKNSIILSVIAVVLMTLASLIQAMISAIVVKSFWSDEISIKFENLQKLDYGSLLGKNLLIYAGVILAIVVVYYVVGLILKKTANFSKLLAAVATAVVPFTILGMIASPLLGMLWDQFGMIFMVLGAVYGVAILVNLVDDVFAFEDASKKIYLHSLVLSILVIAGYYLIMKLLMGSITSSLNFF